MPTVPLNPPADLGLVCARAANSTVTLKDVRFAEGKSMVNSQLDVVLKVLAPLLGCTVEVLRAAIRHAHGDLGPVTPRQAKTCAAIVGLVAAGELSLSEPPNAGHSELSALATAKKTLVALQAADAADPEVDLSAHVSSALAKVAELEAAGDPQAALIAELQAQIQGFKDKEASAPVVIQESPRSACPDAGPPAKSARTMELADVGGLLSFRGLSGKYLDLALEGKYVDFGQVARAEHQSSGSGVRLELQLVDGQQMMSAPVSSKQRQMNPIHYIRIHRAWTSAFAQAVPRIRKPLWDYHSKVVDVAARFPTQKNSHGVHAWQVWESEFRRKAAAILAERQRHVNWRVDDGSLALDIQAATASSSSVCPACGIPGHEASACGTSETAAYPRVARAKGTVPSAQKPCWSWEKSGTCKHKNCKFSHSPADKGKSKSR